MYGLQIITSLARNFADIAFFIIVINRLHPHVMQLSKKLQHVILGALFGISSIISMQISAAVTDGVFLDMETIVVAMAGIYGGYRAGLMAAVIAGGYRYLLGGIGWEPAVWTLIICAMVGVIWRELEQHKKISSLLINHLLFGALIAIVTLACSLALPTPIAVSILTYYSLPLMIITPIASASFRYFIIEWHKPTLLNPELAASKSSTNASAERLQNYMDQSGKTVICIIHIMNFQHSYPFGEDLIKGMCKRITALIPQSFVTHIRENEIICSLSTSEDSERVLAEAAKIQNKLCQPLVIRNRTMHLTVNLGIAIQKHTETAEVLIHHADIALRCTKEQGQPSIMIYDVNLLKNQIHRLKLEEGLLQALSNDELELHFQPQFNIHSGKVRGFEALVRWQHPKLGAVSPGEFIPIAEENGTILPIGLWVLRRACELYQEMLMVPFPEAVISVNISALQLNDSYFPKHVSQILSETGLPPHLLELEITESMLIASIDAANIRLKELTQLGVRIALDDFGTGYSSLHYLNRLPLHLVKLDKSFIRDICKNNEGRITESIIRLVQDLDIQAVAEGVESYDQLYLLKTWKCDIVQGFLLSKPLREQEIAAFITKQTSVAENVITASSHP
ncbi:EAL domain-containing protein [Paenibacillus sp. LMG 31456]|uniref:EAL domain-containing protein n=1 Tax=Paenibacillus foliorum TaxID=2654974 RepID=A0A972GZY0_9BACL|nr:EAL domain-containing protein [Paenibacillus foliorum]NOU93661.1 EAL domain-containing protein [Paenibacillus foliorum]